MIIRCAECSTEFHLPDRKIPADGLKVRCSRCRHVFRYYDQDPNASHDETHLSFAHPENNTKQRQKTLLGMGAMSRSEESPTNDHDEGGNEQLTSPSLTVSEYAFDPTLPGTNVSEKEIEASVKAGLDPFPLAGEALKSKKSTFFEEQFDAQDVVSTTERTRPIDKSRITLGQDSENDIFTTQFEPSQGLQNNESQENRRAEFSQENLQQSAFSSVDGNEPLSVSRNDVLEEGQADSEESDQQHSSLGFSNEQIGGDGQFYDASHGEVDLSLDSHGPEPVEQQSYVRAPMQTPVHSLPVLDRNAINVSSSTPTLNFDRNRVAKQLEEAHSARGTDQGQQYLANQSADAFATDTSRYAEHGEGLDAHSATRQAQNNADSLLWDEMERASFSGSERRAQFVLNFLFILLVLANGVMALVILRNDAVVDFSNFSHMIDRAISGGELELRQEWVDRVLASIPEEEKERFTVEGVFASKVAIGRSDSILVIRGHVKNLDEVDFSDVEVRAIILNEQSRVIAQSKVHAGHIVAPKELSKVRAKKDVAALIPEERVDLKAGGMIPFTIIFEDVPEAVLNDEVVSYRLEVTQYSESQPKPVEESAAMPGN